MFWKRKARPTASQEPQRTFAEWCVRNADIAKSVYHDSRKAQIRLWFDLMETDTGARPRQVDAAATFGLTQGRISQIMH